MWRVLRPLIQGSNVQLQIVRQIQTLRKECHMRTQPCLLKESWTLWRRFPALVESVAGYCTEPGTEPGTDVSDKSELKKGEKLSEDTVKRLFQTYPKLYSEILRKMKYYDQNTMLETAEIKEHYLLKDRDLETLKRYRRKTPYSSRELKGQKFIYLYYKHEVEKLALKKYGNMDIIKKLKQNRDAADKKYSVKMKRFLIGAKAALTGKELRSTGGVVLVAFSVNLFIFLNKLIIYIRTGSSVVFAETVHSFVDLLNQFILLFGQVISKYPPNDRFPYGHRNFLYISSMGSGGFIFAFGCIATLVFGFINGILVTPPVISLETLNTSTNILFFSSVAELGPLIWALFKYNRHAKANNMTFWQCLKEGDDPLTKAVILEDTASVLGTLVCLAAMHAQYHYGLIYGLPMYDLVGNLIITGMLGYVSKTLLMANTEKLIGKSLWYEDDIKRDIERYRYVNGVFDIKSIDQDEDSRFKAEVELDPKEIARVIFATSADQDELLKLMQGLTEPEAAEVLFVKYSEKFYYEIVKFIDDLEEDLKKKYPEIRHIDIEISGGEIPEEKKSNLKEESKQ